MIHEDITLGPVRLILGDCLKIAPTLEGVDAVITDPPYGMNWDTDTTRFSGGVLKVSRGKKWHSKVEQDDRPFDPSPWTEFKRCVLFGSNHFGARLQVGTTLVWLKRYDDAFQSFLSDAEVAWMKGGYGVYCFRSVPGPNQKGLHPTQKPLEVMSWCMDIAKVPPGALVLDPFMGSGTTLIAAIRTGRRSIGIEIDPTHYRAAVERVRRELAQPTFAFEPKPQPKQEVLL